MGRFSLTTSAGGYGVALFDPQMMFSNRVYGNGINTGGTLGFAGGHFGTLFVSDPATLGDTLLTGALPKTLTGQLMPAALTCGNGYVRYVGAEVSVEYLGTSDSCGGVYYCIDGSSEAALVFNRAVPEALTVAQAIEIPLATSQVISRQKTTFRFLNNSAVRPGFWDVPNDIVYGGVSDEYIPQEACQHSSLGFTNAVIISAADPGAKFQITITGWYEDALSATGGGRNPDIPSTTLTVGNPTAHAAASANVATVNHASRNGMQRGWLESAERLVSRTATTWAPRVISAVEAYGSRMLDDVLGFPAI